MADFTFLWLSPEHISAFETMAWRPVYQYDRANKRFSEIQALDQQTGQPVWQGKALVRAGYDGDPTLIDVRTAAAMQPEGGTALMETLTGKSKAAAVASMWEPGGESR